MNIQKTISGIALLLGCCSIGFAQSYYDDDIYFNPTKDKDPNVEATKRAAQRPNGMIYYQITDSPAADTYATSVPATTDIDVDAYNRRGIFAPAVITDSTSVTVVGDSVAVTSDEEFPYTRRIERFYNPAIVASSGDEEVVEYYYAQPANVNIYVANTTPSYWGYPSSYWNWYNTWGWYDPWYSPWYSPWSWSWGWYGPSWSFSWGWNSWWGPSWSWGWGPGWGGPSWGWGGGPAFYNPRHPGAGRHSTFAGAHPTTGARPGVATGVNSRHPAGRASWSGLRQASGTSRPGSITSQGGSLRNSRPGATNSNSYRPGRTNQRQSAPTVNSGNSGSRGGSWGGGSSSGGGRSSGGGGGRGRH